MRRVLAVLAAGLVLVTGCSTEPRQAGGSLQVAESLVAATPAAAPPQTATPAGTVVPLHRPVTALAFDATTRTVAVAVGQPDELLLYPLDQLTTPDAQPVRTLPLPGAPAQLTLAGPGGPLLVPVPTADQVLQVPLPSGDPTVLTVTGGPTSAALVGQHLAVGVPGAGGVAVLRDGQEERRIPSFQSAAGLYPIGEQLLVLDNLHTSVTVVDPTTGTVKEALRAGDGATHAVTDRYDRLLVVDTRGGELLVFSAEPALLMRQRFPVPGAPWAIAYDSRRDLAWITLTATNEVVGYDVAGGEPVERHRFPTVHQPQTVAVDPDSGTVLVASADGEGIQVVQP